MSKDITGGSGFVYDVFITYRHAESDIRWAKWIHRQLEAFRTPASLVKDRGVRPRLRRVFRDEEELNASPSLGSDIDAALQVSRYLLVICSPRTPESEWVNKEVERFLELGRGDRVLALLIEGEPGRSFPKALRAIRPGAPNPTNALEEAEPLAADVRSSRQEPTSYLKQAALLRIVAAVLGCEFYDLQQRHRVERRRTLAMIAFGAAVVVLAFVGVALYAVSESVSRAQAEAEAAAARQREQERLERVVDDLTPSLYLLASGTSNKTPISPMATAWVAAPGVLAGAAHVASYRRASDEMLIALSTKPGVRPVKIIRTVEHPGYLAYQNLRNEYRPLRNIGLLPEDDIGSFDVALFYVAPEDAGDLGPPLKFSSSAVADAPRRGTEFAVLGYPLEGLMSGEMQIFRPSPTSIRASLRRTTGPFMMESAEDAITLELSCHSAGGLSGAPIVNSRGEVLAVLVRSEYAFLQSRSGERRIPLGVSFGQRSDLVTELLDGRADAMAKARIARCRVFLEAVVREQSERWFELQSRSAVKPAPAAAKPSGSQRVPPELIARKTVDAMPGVAFAQSVRLAPDESLVAVALASSFADLRLTIHGSDVEKAPLADQKSVRAVTAVAAPNAAGGVYQIELQSTSATSVELRLFRVSQ